MFYAFFIALAAAVVCCSSNSVSPEPQCCAVGQEEPCGVNEARYPCGRRCEERCNAPLPGNCRGIRCAPPFACRCKNGYARDQYSDRCVPTTNCPRSRCAKHEVPGTCGRTCEGTCAKPYQPEICQRIDCRGAECRCDLIGGYVRNEKTGQCVAIDKC